MDSTITDAMPATPSVVAPSEPVVIDELSRLTLVVLTEKMAKLDLQAQLLQRDLEKTQADLRSVSADRNVKIESLRVKYNLDLDSSISLDTGVVTKNNAS